MRYRRRLFGRIAAGASVSGALLLGGCMPTATKLCDGVRVGVRVGGVVAPLVTDDRRVTAGADAARIVCDGFIPTERQSGDRR